jgi:hypothetical protein
MRVSVAFGAYDARRYGKPWIARVTDWKLGKPPTLAFGLLIEGTPEIEAAAGAVVRWGQRDYRGNNTAKAWGIVQADGTIEPCTERACLAHWLVTTP